MSSIAAYLHHRVTVITTQEVRFEGVLESYDLVKLTLTLTRARNYGTENRPSSNPKFPTENEICVTLSARQLKHISKVADAFDDPAVLSYSTLASHNQSNKKAQSSSTDSRIMEMFKTGGKARSVDLNDLMGKKDKVQQENRKNGRNRNKSEASSQTSSRRVSFRDNVEVKNFGQGKKSNEERGGKQPRGDRRVPQIPKRIPVRFPSDTKDDLLINSRPSPKKTTNSAPKKTSAAKAERAVERGTTRETPGQFQQGERKVKFDEEFDFDKAQEEFKELTIVESKKEGEEDKVEEEEADGPKEYYNKDKSFFDHLSSDAAITDRPKANRRTDMATNKETFGVAFIPWIRSYGGRGGDFRGRNGYRGRGQYGGPRGGYSSRRRGPSFGRMNFIPVR